MSTKSNHKSNNIMIDTPQSPRRSKNRSGADPPDRTEELVKLQERRQQRLMQLRELHDRPSVFNSMTSDPTSYTRSSNPMQAGDVKPLSKSLTLPQTSGRRLSRMQTLPGRITRRWGGSFVNSTSTEPREGSPHPDRDTRQSYTEAHDCNVDVHAHRPPAKSRTHSIPSREAPPNSTRGPKHVPHIESNGHPESTNDTIPESDKLHPPHATPDERTLFQNLCLHNDVDYTKSAQDLSRLIQAMHSEFQTLRDAKAQAESTADKLHTDFTLRQQETEALLLTLSAENDRLKGENFELRVKLGVETKKAVRAQKERYAFQGRLAEMKGEAELRIAGLEEERDGMRKMLEGVGRGTCRWTGVEGGDVSSSARSA